MPSIISVFIIAFMLGVLAVMPKTSLGDGLSAWFLTPWLFGVLSSVLVASAFGLMMTKKLHCFALKRTLQLLLLMVLFVLFGLRAMMAHHEFEQFTIDKPYTVTATVHIDEISDAIYDKFAGTSYRQRARIDDLNLVLHLEGDGMTSLHNPFASPHASMPSVQSDFSQPSQMSWSSGLVSLPSTMTVLLMANANTTKNLHHLDGLTPNTTARMTLLLEPIDTKKGENGFDGNIWLHTRHIHANARVLSIDDVVHHAAYDDFAEYLQGLRQRLRTHFYDDWHTLDTPNQQARAVALSLLTGDRALISRTTKELYQLAGISHLLAISGTHVVFLAVMLAGLITAISDNICPKIYTSLSRWQIRLIVMIVVSVVYAVFTGFDVPAVRTVYMLVMMSIARYLVLPISNLTMLFMVGLFMAWLNPYVLWQAGFWLSFVAVLLLMCYEAQVIQGVPNGFRLWQNIKQLIRLQIWLFIAMLPLSLLFFGKVSLWGVLVNLFAVGLFGGVIVPINLLAGVAFVISPSVADVLWGLSLAILTKIHNAFELFLLGDSWLYAPFGAAGFLLFGLMLLPMLSKILPKYMAVLPLSILTLMLMNDVFFAQKNQTTALRVIPTGNENFQAVLIKNNTQAWLLLSDFGAKPLSISQINILTDGLKRQGVSTLTGVVAQTPNASLPSVVASIHERLPILHYWQAGRTQVSLNTLAVQTCQAGQIYQMEGLSVRALTGWQEIADKTVWGCTIEIQSQQPMQIDLVATADKNAKNFQVAEQSKNYDASDDVVNPATPETIYRVIVNGATHDNTWQLWQWICQDEKSNIAPKKASYDGLWLSHPLSKSDANVQQKFMTAPW
ncbi:ComEC/Rec2 family competence protein [Moraxella sp. Pampa]|uniref:ComEC/Rec2 family competence protein n=1 Tax=Moraxella sp. Pampa TaxID=3111978 RepID=UPI002B417DA1|nr:ComEC/Rec2 family competence protein [Moraxella sp. Pampa]